MSESIAAGSVVASGSGVASAKRRGSSLVTVDDIIRRIFKNCSGRYQASISDVEFARVIIAFKNIHFEIQDCILSFFEIDQLICVLRIDKRFFNNKEIVQRAQLALKNRLRCFIGFDLSVEYSLDDVLFLFRRLFHQKMNLKYRVELELEIFNNCDSIEDCIKILVVSPSKLLLILYYDFLYCEPIKALEVEVILKIINFRACIQGFDLSVHTYFSKLLERCLSFAAKKNNLKILDIIASTNRHEMFMSLNIVFEVAALYGSREFITKVLNIIFNSGSIFLNRKYKKFLFYILEVLMFSLAWAYDYSFLVIVAGLIPIRFRRRSRIINKLRTSIDKIQRSSRFSSLDFRVRELNVATQQLLALGYFSR